MARAKRRRPECDFLEARSLLSGASSHLAAHHHHAHDLARPATPVAVPLEAPGNAVTGGGLLTVGPAPANNSIQLMQDAALDNNLVLFLAQLETLKGSGTTQQTAMSLANDARNVELGMQNVAATLGVNLPYRIADPARGTALQVALASTGSGLDQAYTTAVTAALTDEVGLAQGISTASTNTTVTTFLTTALPVLQADLAAVKGTGTLTPVPTAPSSTTLPGGDVSILATSYSMNVTERFLGQLTDLVTNNSGVKLYADKLLDDHAIVGGKEGMYAAATGTFLPALPQGPALTEAQTVLGAVTSGRRTKRYDRVYLRQMIQSHTMDLATNENVASTATNPVLKQFALMSIPTDVMHRQGAQDALRGNYRG